MHRVDYTGMVWPISNGRLEDDALVVALALSFRLDTVGTGRSFFTTLDTSLSACQAAGLGPLPHLWI